MRLSSQADYALRILILLATSPNEFVATPQIAQTYGLSYNHLNKIVTALSNHGYVEVRRGRKGGARLALAPESILVGEVLRSFERMDLVECLDDERNECAISPACSLTSMFREATDSFLTTLNQYSLADVLHRRTKALRRLFEA